MGGQDRSNLGAPSQTRGISIGLGKDETAKQICSANLTQERHLKLKIKEPNSTTHSKNSVQ